MKISSNESISYLKTKFYYYSNDNSHCEFCIYYTYIVYVFIFSFLFIMYYKLIRFVISVDTFINCKAKVHVDLFAFLNSSRYMHVYLIFSLQN